MLIYTKESIASYTTLPSFKTPFLNTLTIESGSTTNITLPAIILKQMRTVKFKFDFQDASSFSKGLNSSMTFNPSDKNIGYYQFTVTLEEQN